MLLLLLETMKKGQKSGGGLGGKESYCLDVTVVLSDFEHKDVLWVKLTDAVWEYIKT